MKLLVFAFVVFLFNGFDQSDANGILGPFPLGAFDRVNGVDGTGVTGLGGIGGQPGGCHTPPVNVPTPPVKVPSTPCSCSNNLGCGQCNECGGSKKCVKVGKDYPSGGILGQLLSGF